MSGDEVFVMKEEQLFGVELEGQFLRSVEVRHGVAIGVDDDVTATVGADGPHDRAVVGHHRQWSEPGLLFGEQIDGFTVGFPVQADVGDGVSPLIGSGMDGGEGRDLQAVEKVFLHIAHAVFHASFFVPFSNIAGDGLKAVVSRHVQVARIEKRLFTGGMAEDPDL